MVANLTISKSDALPGGNDPALPGDTIRYTVTIANTGDMDATNTALADEIDSNTTFTAGTLDITPIARDDSFDSLGNVGITVPVANGVLTNDVDLDGDSVTVTEVQGNAANIGVATNTDNSGLSGVFGTVTLAADGSFTYEPPPGFVGTDTFEYTVTDNEGDTDTATVSITISDMIWFIDNSSGGANQGTLNNPFTSITDFNNAQGASRPNAIAGDSIFIDGGSGNYSTGITLQDNQILVGEGATATIETITGLTSPTFSNSLPSTGGSNPVVDGNIVLASGNTIRGFTLNGGMTGSNVGTLSVSEMTINSGAIEGLDIDAVSGSNVADIEVVDSIFAGGEAIRVESTGSARYDLDVIDSTFTDATNDIQAIVGGSGGVHDINYIGNTSTNSNNNSGGDFVIQMLNGADVTFDIQGNNIQLGAQLFSGDAIQVVGDGNAEGRIGGASASDGNTIDGAGGDGIRLDMGGSSTQSAGNINWTILIQNNDIGATDGVADEGIQILSDNHSGTINLTVEDNTIANTGEQGLQIFHGNEVDFSSGGNIFARVANNTFTNIPDATETILIQTLDGVTLDLDIQGNDGNGLDGGSGGDEIELDEFGSSTFRLEQTSAANISSVNNSASVEFDTSITDFGVAVDPTLPSNPLKVNNLPASDISSREILTDRTNETTLTETELEIIVSEAINRWTEAGLSEAQIETLESVTYEITDLRDWYIGSASGTHIQIDTNAFGWNWFVDSTPEEDSEFSQISANSFEAEISSPAFGQIDLLTTVMHEMGHVLGLSDVHGRDNQAQLMSSHITAGTRLTPAFDIANNAVPRDSSTIDYATVDVNLGTLNAGQSVTIEFDTTVNDPLDPVSTTSVTNSATVTADGGISENDTATTNVECFLPGTHILTEKGEVTVENLKIGDLVLTTDGKLESIKWVGRQTVKKNQVKNPLRGYPVLIKAGALGSNLPHRDLYVSPDHSMFIDGLLINAGALVNDISIVKTEPNETFTYYHIELENHSLLLAEGTAAESYLPQKENRNEYDNFYEYEELYPQRSNLMLWPMDFPRISSWNKVPRFVNKKLMRIAHQLEGQLNKIKA